MGKALIIKGADFSANGIALEYFYDYTWEQGGISPSTTTDPKNDLETRIRTTDIKLKSPVKFSVTGDFTACFFKKQEDGSYILANDGGYVKSGIVDDSYEGVFVVQKNNINITPDLGSSANLIISRISV